MTANERVIDRLLSEFTCFSAKKAIWGLSCANIFPLLIERKMRENIFVCPSIAQSIAKALTTAIDNN
jgi:hypothetical protein